jgi:hypothetical protein
MTHVLLIWNDSYEDKLLMDPIVALQVQPEVHIEPTVYCDVQIEPIVELQVLTEVHMEPTVYSNAMIGVLYSMTSAMTVAFNDAFRKWHMEFVNWVFKFPYKIPHCAVRSRTLPDSGFYYKSDTVNSNMQRCVCPDVPKLATNFTIFLCVCTVIMNDTAMGRYVAIIIRYFMKQSTTKCESDFITASTCVELMVNIALVYLSVLMCTKSCLLDNNQSYVNCSTQVDSEMPMQHSKIPLLYKICEASPSDDINFIFILGGSLNPADLSGKYWSYVQRLCLELLVPWW